MTQGQNREPPPGTGRVYWRPDPDTTDEEIDAWAERFVDAVLGEAVEQESDQEGFPLGDTLTSARAGFSMP